MLKIIKDLYTTQDLPGGDCLLQPLKKVPEFFGKKITESIDNSDSVKAMSWRIAHLVVGIFAYPIFGLLAIAGMGIKLVGLPALILHNQNEKSRVISGCQLPIDLNEGRGGDGYGSLDIDQRQEHLLKTYWECTLTRNDSPGTHDDFSEQARRQINQFTMKFKKVYVYTSGQIEDDGTGALNLALKIMRRH